MNKENKILKENLDTFWLVLEYELSDGFYMSDIPELKGFWCDGIFLDSDDYQLKKKFINDNRQIQLVAYIGKTGQEKYNATIYFGRKAQSRYARGLSLEVCIPENDNDWFEIDVRKKVIDIFLL